ncbi:glycosyltransferase [Raineyella fluvialis]|uniref:Glycosyltransferase n=1 Tax=Raineyella fluvialis TaxID=2662261 RepID=A0A5Q2F922_9ACTN|nr:glycosyltransferase [Raineyella fluvialis]QGF23402.1 glycosyltransferase [Raineyella fluvialis]
MKILHVVNNLETGGAQTLIEALTQEQQSLGVETHVVVLLSRGTLSDRIEAVARSVVYLEIHGVSDALIVGARRLKKAIRRIAPDIVHSHLLQADLLSILAATGIPHVSTVHTSGGHEASLPARIVTWLLSQLSSSPDAVIACSPSAALFSCSRLRRQPDAIILNGTALPDNRVLRVGQRDYVLHLARWHPMKDHDTLFQAVELLGPCAPQLVCAGEGMTVEGGGAKLVARYPSVNATFEGPVPEVSRYFANALCLVISSSHGEALPMAGIEALSHGVPVVTTDVGDCRLLAVEPKLVVPPKDIEAIAAAIAYVKASNEETPTRLASLARAVAEKTFNVKQTAAAYRRVYDNVLQERGDS